MTLFRTQSYTWFFEAPQKFKYCYRCRYLTLSQLPVPHLSLTLFICLASKKLGIPLHKLWISTKPKLKLVLPSSTFLKPPWPCRSWKQEQGGRSNVMRISWGLLQGESLTIFFWVNTTRPSSLNFLPISFTACSVSCLFTSLLNIQKGKFNVLGMMGKPNHVYTKFLFILFYFGNNVLHTELQVLDCEKACNMLVLSFWSFLLFFSLKFNFFPVNSN